MSTTKDHYGSITTEDSPLIVPDVEGGSPLIVDEDNVQVGVYANSSASASQNKKSWQRLFVVCAALAVVACFVVGPVSPLGAAQGKVGGPWGPPTAGASGAMFDWKAYGQSIKQYWAEKKAYVPLKAIFLSITCISTDANLEMLVSCTKFCSEA